MKKFKFYLMRLKCDRKMLKTKNKKMAKRKVKDKNTKTSAKTQKVSNKT